MFISITKYLNEEFMYHVSKRGGLDLENVKPNVNISDNKDAMRSRETGHFGSGIYFSTYNGEYDHLGIESGNYNPNLIQVDDLIYRVDDKLYKNLFRCTSSAHAQALYQTLGLVNAFFNKFCDRDREFIKNTYLKIYHNCPRLGLKCPEFKEMLKMCERLRVDDRKGSSFSTIFMIYNGYNGVNVNNIPDFDNTTHGSVIYDVYKLSDVSKQPPSHNYNGKDWDDVIKNRVIQNINVDNDIDTSLSNSYSTYLGHNTINGSTNSSPNRSTYEAIQYFNALPESQKKVYINTCVIYFKYFDYDMIDDKYKNFYLRRLPLITKNVIDERYLDEIVDRKLYDVLYKGYITKKDKRTSYFYEWVMRSFQCEKHIQEVYKHRTRELSTDEIELLNREYPGILKAN